MAVRLSDESPKNTKKAVLALSLAYVGQPDININFENMEDYFLLKCQNSLW